MASKLIHPSSHVIKGFENTPNDPPNNQFFALPILMYGWGLIRSSRVCLDRLTSPVACLPSNQRLADL